MLCVILDRTPLEQAAAVLSALGAPTTSRPEPLVVQDWNETAHPRRVHPRMRPSLYGLLAKLRVQVRVILQPQLHERPHRERGAASP